jgi:hypothetical protein
MAEEKDTNFKITDRRKFNADGTPREHVFEPEPPAPAQAAPEPAAAEPASPGQAEAAQAGDRAEDKSAAQSANVVSFPTEAKKKDPREAAAASGEQAGGERPTAPHDAARDSASAAERAYNQASSARPRSSGVPEASLLSLLNMLAVEAAMSLGLIESPVEGAPPVDLETARHMIDLLGVIQSKTRGNLTDEEEKLLENILTDLRMQYVALSRRR